MKIRIRLREILADRGISQRQLSLKLNMRPATISHLCSDNVDRVYLRTLEQICDALDINVDQLVVSEADEGSEK
jgi:putative transcriptional regulator